MNTIFYYRLALCHFFCAIFHLRHYLLILNYMVYGDCVSFIHSNYSGFINIRLELELKGHLPCISWNSPNGGYIALTHLFVHSARRRKSRLLLISFFFIYSFAFSKTLAKVEIKFCFWFVVRGKMFCWRKKVFSLQGRSLFNWYLKYRYFLI